MLIEIHTLAIAQAEDIQPVPGIADGPHPGVLTAIAARAAPQALPRPCG